MSARNEDRNELVSQMATHCGADIAEAFRQGVIGPRQYSEYLARCSKCEATDACKRLLAAVAELEKAPEYCQNSAELEELKDRLAKANPAESERSLSATGFGRR